MAENAMPGEGGGVIGFCGDQLATSQGFERGLNGALGKAGRVRDGAEARSDGGPIVADGLAVEVEINEKGGRLMIVPDKIAHEDIEHVIIDRDSLAEAGHGGNDE
jgi:hypothetical protein